MCIERTVALLSCLLEKKLKNFLWGSWDIFIRRLIICVFNSSRSQIFLNTHLLDCKWFRFPPPFALLPSSRLWYEIPLTRMLQDQQSQRTKGVTSRGDQITTNCPCELFLAVSFGRNVAVAPVHFPHVYYSTV